MDPGEVVTCVVFDGVLHFLAELCFLEEAREVSDDDFQADCGLLSI